MKRLIRLEWLKIRANATFWVLISLHAGILLLVVLSGKFFAGSLSVNGTDLKDIAGVKKIPIYQFPDIWQNITYVAGFLKFIPAIYVIISITSEISYDTLRQNIMNGISRKDFILSKVLLVVLISAISVLVVFIAGAILGFTNTSDIRAQDVTKYLEFIPAYFLQLVVYLIFALLLGLLIRRTGLAMALLFLYSLIIEPIVGLRIGNDMIRGFLPMKSINNLIHMPFGKYMLREVQDFVTLREVSVVLVYAAVFMAFLFLLLEKRDLK
jgi:ABC-2 type transport system permease protein